jgi:ribosomal protein L44E
MVVYCDGPPDNAGHPTHARHPVKRYVRKLDATADCSYFWSTIAGADDPRPKPSKGRKLRFHCRVCGFDEKRSNGINEKFTTRISEIFEVLHATGTHEVNVRVLVKWLLPALTT